MVKIKLYKWPQTVTVTMITTNTTNMNLPLTDTDFKVYKGVDNPIDFIVKDNNGRPVDLTNLIVSIIVSDLTTTMHLLTKPAEITNAICGKFRIMLLSSDTSNWQLDFQHYSLIIESSNGITQPLFMDQNHNANGFFELLGGITPEPKSSMIVLPSEWTPVSLTPGVTKYISCSFPGDAIFGDADGLHTIALYANNYSGKFYVQGSLEESVTQNDIDWFDIWLTQLRPEVTLTNYSGIEPFNFTGSIRWIRFAYLPDSTNTGSITKVAYRH